MKTPHIKVNNPVFATLRRHLIAIAVSSAFSLCGAAQAATFDVTVSSDPGDASVANTLSWAIRQANVTAGTDTIILKTNVSITGVMKNLINSDLTLQSDTGSTYAINGNNQFRPLFVKSGNITIKNLTLSNGKALGGRGSGGGAGLGGALFTYVGNVVVDKVTFSNNNATGGIPSGNSNNGGGGGGGGSGGGGMFAANASFSGGYGGNGNYNGAGGNSGSEGSTTGNRSQGGNGANGSFGGGGGKGGSAGAFLIVRSYGGNGGNGGFSGGGGSGGAAHSYDSSGSGPGGNATGGNGGNGGFGGGGGNGGSASINRGWGIGGNGGNGGFGGGGGGGGSGNGSTSSYGVNRSINGNAGIGGFGGGNGNGLGSGGGAGFGGAIFAMKGTTTLIDVTFSNNTVVAGTGANNGSASGADIFICTSDLHSTASLCSATVNQCGTTSASGVFGTLGTDCPVTDSPPVVSSPIADVTVDEDATNWLVDLASTFSDPDGDAITLSVSGNSNSTLVTPTLSGTGLTLAFAPNLSGTANITIRATANGQTVEDTFTVTVNPVDDAPTVLSPVTDVTVDEDAAASTLDLSGVFTDVENDSITLGVVGNTNGALVTPTLSGNTLTLAYSPNQNGTTNITLRATANGKTEEDTFTVTVNPVDDAPTLANPIADVTVDEDATNTGIALGNAFADIDSTITLSVVGNTNSTLVTPTLSGNTLTLAYATNQSGTANITIRATADGKTVEDTFTVTVNPVDDAPTVVSPVTDVTVDEDAAASTLDLSSVFVDVENDSITLGVAGNTNGALVTPTLSGNTLTLAYAANQSGTANITIRATANGKTTDETFTVTVNPADDAPTVANPVADVTVDEDAANTSIAIGNAFADIDSTITLSVVGNTNSALVTPTLTGNTLTLAYAANQSGTANITIRATADGKTVEDTFTVTVNPVDDAPTVASPVTDVTVDEDAAASTLDLSGVFTDVENDTITLSVAGNTNGALVTPTLNGNTLTLAYAANQSGTANITLRATANGKMVEDTFSVTVNPVDDAPTLANPIADVTVGANAADKTVALGDVFSDLDGDSITLNVAGNSNSALVTPTLNGTVLNLAFIPNQSGTTRITIRATANGKSMESTFTVTIQPPPAYAPPTDFPPVVFKPMPDVTVDEDAVDSHLDLTDVFYDLNHDAMTLEVVRNTNSSLLTATIKNNRLTLAYAPSRHGTAEITLRATANGKSVEDTFTVTVNPVDDPPVLVKPLADMRVEQDAGEAVIGLGDTFIDPDGESLSFNITSNTNSKLVVPTLDGPTLTLAFASGESGTATLTLRATSRGKTVEDSFVVDVSAKALATQGGVTTGTAPIPTGMAAASNGAGVTENSTNTPTRSEPPVSPPPAGSGGGGAFTPLLPILLLLGWFWRKLGLGVSDKSRRYQ